jgi:hypothetical protein
VYDGFNAIQELDANGNVAANVFYSAIAPRARCCSRFLSSARRARKHFGSSLRPQNRFVPIPPIERPHRSQTVKGRPRSSSSINSAQQRPGADSRDKPDGD